MITTRALRGNSDAHVEALPSRAGWSHVPTTPLLRACCVRTAVDGGGPGRVHRAPVHPAARHADWRARGRRRIRPLELL